MKRNESSWNAIDDEDEEEDSDKEKEDARCREDDDDEDAMIEEEDRELEEERRTETTTTTTSKTMKREHSSNHLLKYLKRSISTIDLPDLPDLALEASKELIEDVRLKMTTLLSTSSENASRLIARMSQSMQLSLIHI